MPAQGVTICNGGANCPDVVIPPVAVTGTFSSLSPLKIEVGGTLDVELVVDGSVLRDLLGGARSGSL